MIAERPAAAKLQVIRSLYRRLAMLHQGTVEYEALSQQIHAESQAYLELTGQAPLHRWKRRKTDQEP